MTAVDPRAPCIVGVATRTWRRDETGDDGAPEPLDMWEQVVRDAARDAGAGADVLEHAESLRIVYCQSWQYDDATQRLCERLRIAPKHRFYSGIGGTVPQQLVNDAAEQILRGEAGVAVVCGAEALDTKARFKKRGDRWRGSFPPPAGDKRPFPYEAPFHDAEVAHDVFQAWLTFAIFDNARRGHFATPLDAYRSGIGEMMAPMTRVAARNPDAWFPVERDPLEIVTPTPQNRMVGYPYTKYTISVMDVDMAASVILASHEQADALGVPLDRRVYLRGWCYATDPVYVAQHHDLWRSPAMEAASSEALGIAGVGVDDVAHLDLYSCFASSLHLACDALGIDPTDARGLTVTGGLPYHGGAGSDYMTHSIATMARTLRDDPDAIGLCSGVGMHMTKHVYALYSTAPGPVVPPRRDEVQAKLDAAPQPAIVAAHDGPATVAAYSVVHGSDGAPQWGVLVCDLESTDGGAGAARAYARVDDPDDLAAAEAHELVGASVQLTSTPIDLVTGGRGTRNVARLGAASTSVG
jgi:acetyl-CoA C-acetyltransferase